MKTPHKHAEFIKAWADGAPIQAFYEDSQEWHDCDKTVGPIFAPSIQYRIKPEPNPDVVVEWLVEKDRVMYFNHARPKLEKNLRLTLYGETGKLKSAEVL